MVRVLFKPERKRPLRRPWCPAFLYPVGTVVIDRHGLQWVVRQAYVNDRRSWHLAR